VGLEPTFLFCVLPDDLQVPALRELGRVVKSGGTIRLYRRTEESVPEAGLEVVGSRLVVDDLIKLISIRK
jgi:hypothetical protein